MTASNELRHTVACMHVAESKSKEDYISVTMSRIDRWM